MFKFFKRKQPDTEPEETKPVIDDEDDDDEESAPGGRFVVSRRLDQGMPISYLDKDGKVLSKGRITEESTRRLVISRLPNATKLEPVEEGTRITIMAYNTDLEHVKISATVLESSITRLVVEDWSLAQSKTFRDSERLPVEISAVMYVPGDVRHREDIQCTIHDLSEGGACVSSNTVSKVGDERSLHFEAFKGDGLITIPGCVVWAKPGIHGDVYDFGLLFAEMPGYKKKELRASLKELHARIVRETQQ